MQVEAKKSLVLMPEEEAKGFTDILSERNSRICPPFRWNGLILREKRAFSDRERKRTE